VLSCSDELLRFCGEWLDQHPGCYAQTHINENRAEIEAVRQRFPNAEDYLDVYDRFGLVRRRTVLAHNVHPQERELSRLAETGAPVCHCASSNAYLGSGLFPMARHVEQGAKIMTGTDVAAGRSFSLLEELAQIHFIQKLLGTELLAQHLLFLATLAGAQALDKADDFGNLESGKWADFIVLQPELDPYLNARLSRCESLDEQLFVLLHQHQRSHVSATYIAGEQVHPSWPARN